jgi:hypothetical protein
LVVGASTPVSAFIACYLLASTLLALINISFLTKLTFIGPVASNERTFLLFMMNLLQVNLTFAILYRLALPELQAGQALFRALLVFGTMQHPVGAEVSAGAQIVVDFVLLGVFLAFFVGNLGR